jgi:hypothetical protein
MTAQGIDVNVFDGLPMSGMLPVHASASLSAAEMNPVGGFVNRSGKTVAFDESFHQQRTIPVQSFPIFRQAACGERKNPASKTLNGKVWRNEKAAVGNDELKVLFPLQAAPSDPCIAGRHFPCRTGELEAGKIPARQCF